MKTLQNLYKIKREITQELTTFCNSKDIVDRMSYEYLYKADEDYHDQLFDTLQAVSREIEIRQAESVNNDIINRVLIKQIGYN